MQWEPAGTSQMGAYLACLAAKTVVMVGSSDDPHGFVIEGTVGRAPRSGALPWNVSWYHREFSLPVSARDKLIWLTFDGVYRNADKCTSVEQ